MSRCGDGERAPPRLETRARSLPHSLVRSRAWNLPEKRGIRVSLMLLGVQRRFSRDPHPPWALRADVLSLRRSGCCRCSQARGSHAFSILLPGRPAEVSQQMAEDRPAGEVAAPRAPWARGPPSPAVPPRAPPASRRNGLYPRCCHVRSSPWRCLSPFACSLMQYLCDATFGNGTCCAFQVLILFPSGHDVLKIKTVYCSSQSDAAGSKHRGCFERALAQFGATLHNC
ncbi:hypothetical protein Z043_101623 [Scleropages formosus]|uniref:Uncharacterized protein n=1 Tax=Scleropages formosus TaxID=113540 RepID=A0A0P7VR75_SCLFO|nr:hypothetical protein Z043_101623 [Scleropages formosus]